MAANASNVLSTDLQLVVFQLADEFYGVEIATVQEIIVMHEVTTIPRGPELIDGVINLRGRIVPVIDLRTCFGLPRGPHNRATRIVVVSVGAHTLGLVVDAVSQVLVLDRGQFEPPSQIVASARTNYLRGIATLDDKMLIWLDLGRILTVEQNADLDAAVGEGDELSVGPSAG